MLQLCGLCVELKKAPILVPSTQKPHLKEDARGESKTGNKAWLRRRLHVVLVHAHLEAAGADPD